MPIANIRIMEYWIWSAACILLVCNGVRTAWRNKTNPIFDKQVYKIEICSVSWKDTNQKYSTKQMEVEYNIASVPSLTIYYFLSSLPKHRYYSASAKWCKNLCMPFSDTSSPGPHANLCSDMTVNLCQRQWKKYPSLKYYDDTHQAAWYDTMGRVWLQLLRQLPSTRIISD